MSEIKEIRDHTDATIRAVERWKSARGAVQSARAAVSRAECDERNARSEVAKLLLPRTAQRGDRYAFWYGNDLIEVTATADGLDPVVEYNEGAGDSARR